MPNTYVNKVQIVRNGSPETLIDLTSDTVTASTLISGYTAHDASGALINGTAVPATAAGVVTQDQDGYLILDDEQATLRLGALRPDAELVHQWTYDKYLVEDEEIEIPEYTTSTVTLKAASNLTPTIPVDQDNYRYAFYTRGLVIPEYSVDTKSAGRQIYSSISQFYELIRMKYSEYTVDGITGKSGSAVSTSQSYGNTGTTMYWGGTESSPTLQMSTTVQGFSMANPSHGFNNAEFVAKLPAFRTYSVGTCLNETYWNLITDVRFQCIIELYRVPKRFNGLDGWLFSQTNDHCYNCYKTPSQTLT